MLVDARNLLGLLDKLSLKGAKFIGLDIETSNHRARTEANTDLARVVVTGLSLCADTWSEPVYFNLAHADMENRISWTIVRSILETKDPEACFIVHNLVYERTILRAAFGYLLPANSICTMQMAVSAYNVDEYDLNKFYAARLTNMSVLFPEVCKAFSNYNPDKGMTPQQAEVFGKIGSKTTDSAWSYNGFVKDLAYGYGLKKAVKSFFGVQMQTYDETLKKLGVENMAQATGEGVAAYGGDDAYWCLKLFFRLYQFMLETNPRVIQTFFEQELPMTEIFSDIWFHGIRIDAAKVREALKREQAGAAQLLRELKPLIRSLFPVTHPPVKGLMDEKWYWDLKKPEAARGVWTYRDRWWQWASSRDYPATPEGDDYQILQTNGGAAKSVSKEKQGIINITHYMPLRTLYYDLMYLPILKSQGKIASDKDARGKLVGKAEEGSVNLRILNILSELSRIDQVCKLYLVPYLALMDPDTGRVHPQISSMLASRRMSMYEPNGQQLAKRGESVYVRGFYLPDNDRHLLVSADWNSIELVIPGEMSQDPEFVRCFSKVPYDDLHSGAAAAMLDLTKEEFKLIKSLPDDVHEIAASMLAGQPVKFVSRDGSPLTPKKFVKYARVEYGKGANFSYWFSGALSTLAEKMGWSDEEHWRKVENYRQTFPVAEAWRVGVIEDAVRNGVIYLPDGHRRTRFEATNAWADCMMNKFLEYSNDPGMINFARVFIKKQQTRAKNQAVNSKVQGTAATLAKRSAVTLRKAIQERWSEKDCRFVLPIHDELVCSVDRDLILPYRQLIYDVMCTHPDLFKTCRLNCSVSIGRNFEPFDPIKAPFGQVELDEAPEDVAWLPPEIWKKKMEDSHVLQTVKYLFGEL